MNEFQRLIPIFTTRGDVGAFLSYPHIFNRQGEWIGWVTQDRQVFSLQGFSVGKLSDDPRILRSRSADFSADRRELPPIPTPIHPPALTQLAPMMSELPMNMMDVLDEDPDLLPTLDAGEFRQDLD